MIETNFKHTDIGLIPHDWEVKKLGAIYSFRYGIGNTNPNNGGKYPIYGANGVIGGYSKYNAEDSIVIGHMGEYAGSVLWAEGKHFVTYNGTITRPKEENSINAKYGFYALLKLNINNICAGSGYPFLAYDKLNSLKIPLPPTLAEQEKIANALSKMDQLINNLGALIEKKKAIKQGTMQDLLTAKRRIKGFTEEWNSVKLGDLLEYRQPTKYLVSSKEYTTQGVPVLTAGKTFILGYTQENWGLYDDLPVIIFDDFVVESKYVTMPFKVKSSAIKMLSLREKENDLRFIFEKMQCIEFPIADHKRHWISEYSQLEITIPEPNEQRAIANILSSMDTEITNLEQKRNKYMAIKQGMMQNLLTGKIRLI